MDLTSTGKQKFRNEPLEMRKLLFLMLLLSAPLLADQIDQLSWLSGRWVEAETEEHWSTVEGGTMLAYNRSVKDGKTVFFEFLRIHENPEGIIYWASPLGGKPTPFKLKELSEQRVLFVNPEHDFPQRIEYRRQGDQLFVEISDSGSKSASWVFRRANSGAASDDDSPRETKN